MAKIGFIGLGHMGKPMVRNLLKAGHSLKVYDIMGRPVATLAEGVLTPGNYTSTWNASGLASGVYYYRLEAGGYRKTRMMILLR